MTEACKARTGDAWLSSKSDTRYASPVGHDLAVAPDRDKRRHAKVTTPSVNMSCNTVSGGGQPK